MTGIGTYDQMQIGAAVGSRKVIQAVPKKFGAPPTRQQHDILLAAGESRSTASGVLYCLSKVPPCQHPFQHHHAGALLTQVNFDLPLHLPLAAGHSRHNVCAHTILKFRLLQRDPTEKLGRKLDRLVRRGQH
jgi:hypothetical protein